MAAWPRPLLNVLISIATQPCSNKVSYGQSNWHLAPYLLCETNWIGKVYMLAFSIKNMYKTFALSKRKIFFGRLYCVWMDVT